jgi:hypothetical protein
MFGDSALRLLDLPPDEMHSRLADVCDTLLESQFREELERRLSRLGEHSYKLGAWATLLPLVGRKLTWACDLATRYWPRDLREVEALFSVDTISKAGEGWLLSRFEPWASQVSPSRACDAYDICLR